MCQALTTLLSCKSRHHRITYDPGRATSTTWPGRDEKSPSAFTPRAGPTPDPLPPSCGQSHSLQARYRAEEYYGSCCGVVLSAGSPVLRSVPLLCWPNQVGSETALIESREVQYNLIRRTLHLPAMQLSQWRNSRSEARECRTLINERVFCSLPR
jgi:hypothetical protein